MSSDDIPSEPDRPELGINHDTRKLFRTIAREITDTDFQDWYRQFKFKENIRNGQSYFNGPPSPKPAGRFSPSELLKCHRKIYYKHHVAPQETENPDGIFYFGERFEEELAEKYLADSVSVAGTYLQNSLWMQTSLDTEIGEITVVGSTDPVVVDENGEPILLTEIKTTSSIEYTDEPKEHHLAQASAYLYGLTNKYDRQVRDVVFLYADRDSLDTKTFHEVFDQSFWEDRVVSWMKQNTYYRVFGILPPAEPEHGWECDFCDYRARCGQTEATSEDENPAGFVPGMAYPREKVKNYLQAHSEAGLTPTLAHDFPDLTETYDVFDWSCDSCYRAFEWDEIQSPNDGHPPCPECETGYLSGPKPENQHHIDVVDRPEEGSS